MVIDMTHGHRCFVKWTQKSFRTTSATLLRLKLFWYLAGHDCPRSWRAGGLSFTVRGTLATLPIFYPIDDTLFRYLRFDHPRKNDTVGGGGGGPRRGLERGPNQSGGGGGCGCATGVERFRNCRGEEDGNVVDARIVVVVVVVSGYGLSPSCGCLSVARFLVERNTVVSKDSP